MSRRIDAHQHFWRLDRGDYRWLTPALAPLYRDFLPRDLAPKLRAHAIDATILVQAADSLAESQFLLALAEANTFIAGVVVWVDLEARDAVDHLNALARHPKCVGVRPMIQDIADDAWMLKAECDDALRAVAQLGLTFDALVKPRHLPYLIRLAERHPDMKLVVDHGAKPAVAAGRNGSEFAKWRANLKELAQSPRVHCKLSGLVTEAGPEWTTEDLEPFVEVLWETFGGERLMWGSDWPVVELAGGYDVWWSAAHRLLGSLTVEQRDAVFGGNAATTYGLPGSN